MRISQFLIRVGYVLLISTPFGSRNHANTFILRSNRPSINMVLDGTDPDNNSPWRYAPNINIWLVLQFWNQLGGFFDTIIDVEYWYLAFTYTLVQDWYIQSSQICPPSACHTRKINSDQLVIKYRCCFTHVTDLANWVYYKMRLGCPSLLLLMRTSGLGGLRGVNGESAPNVSVMICATCKRISCWTL